MNVEEMNNNQQLITKIKKGTIPFFFMDRKKFKLLKNYINNIIY